MKEQYISFETATLAKEKGFNYIVYGMYRGQDTYWTSGGIECICGFDEELNDWEDEVERIYKWLTPRPTQSLLHKCLREKHGIHILVIPTVTSDWTFKTIRVISEIDKDVISGLKSVSDLPPYQDVCGYDYSTYEEALEHGLIEALKLIN